MFKDKPLGLLRRNRQIAYYFRYPLHHGDFHELREDGLLVGRFAAKPLFSKLTSRGRIDRSAGYSARVAVIFAPAKARPARFALLLTRIAKDRSRLQTGQRNCAEVRSAGKKAVRRLAWRRGPC